MPKNKEFGIKKQDFQLLDTYDKVYREHTLIAQAMRERLVILQHTLLEEIDPELAERYKKEFIQVEIDWDKKMLVIHPTNDPAKKAEEATELIKKHAKN